MSLHFWADHFLTVVVSCDDTETLFNVDQALLRRLGGHVFWIMHDTGFACKDGTSPHQVNHSRDETFAVHLNACQ